MNIARFAIPSFIALAACGPDGAGSSPSPSSASPAPPPASSVGASPSDAQTALDALDGRTPVPLLPMMANHQKQNMRDHLAAVQEIVAAVGAKDFAAIEKAAGRIGYSEQMGQMCTHMGAGAPGFTDAALAFHHQADAIGDAAKQHDLDAVQSALAETLAKCTGCHATYRQQVVDTATWERLAQQPAPHPEHP